MKTITVIQEVQVPIKETGWHKFWQRMNGNRTMILSIVATGISFTPVPEPYKAILLGIISIAGGTTLVQHVKNGGFKRSVKGVQIEK